MGCVCLISHGRFIALTLSGSGKSPGMDVVGLGMAGNMNMCNSCSRVEPSGEVLTTD